MPACLYSVAKSTHSIRITVASYIYFLDVPTCVDVHVYCRLRISTLCKEALPMRPANEKPVSSSKVERKSPPANGSVASCV